MEMPPVNPSASDVRTAKRRAAGVHAAWIWGGVFVVLALIFTILYLALDARREKAWRRSIKAALQREDVDECAALLAACRREQPDLAKRAVFAAWESRYLTLQSRRETRRAAFDAKFTALQQSLDSADWVKLDWPQELAELARLADTEAELSRIQALRLRSEALSRSETLTRSAAVAKELAAARNELKRLAEFRKTSDFGAFAKLQDALHHKMEALKLATQGNPDLAESFRRLEADFTQEAAAAKRAEKSFLEEEKAYQAILGGGHAEEIARRIQSYLARYPESPRNAMLRGVLAELELVHYPFADEAERELAALREREAAALRALRHDVAVMQGENCTLPETERAGLDALAKRVNEVKDLAGLLDEALPPDVAPWSAAWRDAVTKARRTLSPDAGKLGVPVGAWHALNRKLWSEALENVPCFAGLLMQGEFRSAGVMRQGSDAWLADVANGQPEFIRAGSLNGTEFADEVGVNSILRTLWVPAGNWHAAARRAEFEREAAKLGAPQDALKFPVYWVKPR